jgi:RimJ/RimL family protein N-acetyltransferase
VVAVLETPRLRLRELEADDLEPLLEVLGDAGAMRYYPAPFGPAQVRGWIAWARDSYRTNGFGLWAVVRRSDGRFLGDCGPMLQPVEGRLIPEIGYHIVPAEQGNGYATEAARACRDWLFDHTDYEVVCSLVSPENEPSRAVAAKVHAAMREFTWEKHDRLTCLYWTDRMLRSAGPTTLTSRSRSS